MAIVYLGQNDLSKKINNIYIGINNQSKKVVKGYIGINGYSKLFYGGEFYPTLYSSNHSQQQFKKPVLTVVFNISKEIMDYWGPKYLSVSDERGCIIQDPNSYSLWTPYSKIFLGENCWRLFNANYYSTGPMCYDEFFETDGNTIVPFNLEKYFLFNKVIDLSNLFYTVYSLNTKLSDITGNLANCNFINVKNMSYSFYGCIGLTESPQCGPNVINMSYTYFRCNNLTGSPKSGPNVINMHNTYYDCNNLTGSPVCGDKVEDMVCTYYGCNNLTGSPVCGPNVINMHYTYTNCRNLTGSPACGPNVTNMRYAYYMCTNITGDPICGPNVICFDACYTECRYLGKNVNIGEKVTSAVSTYMRAGTWNEGLILKNIYVGKYGAINLSNCFRESNVDGDIYILNNSSNITYIFNSRHQTAKIINIHYPAKETISQVNSRLSSIKITDSSEKHTIVESTYIDIRSNNETPYNIRIYADYVES